LQLLISPKPDERIAVIQDTLKMAKEQEKALRLRLHKINMQAANLVVKSPNQGSNNNNMPGMFEDGGDNNKGGFPFSLRGGGKPKRGGGMLGGFANMV
jgi:hypothetical protein